MDRANQINNRIKLIYVGALGCVSTQRILFLGQRDCINALQHLNHSMWLSCIELLLDKYVPQTKIVNDQVFKTEDLRTDIVDANDLERIYSREPNSKI